MKINNQIRPMFDVLYEMFQKKNNPFNPWQMGFIYSIGQQIEQKHLTEKQTDKIREIYYDLLEKREIPQAAKPKDREEWEEF